MTARILDHPTALGTPEVAKSNSGKKRVRARDRGEVVPLGIEISPQMDKAIEDCRAKLRWTKKVLVEAALEAFLAEHDFWPPSDAPSDS